MKKRAFDDGPLRSHVALIDDFAVASGTRINTLVHVEVALDLRAVDFLRSERVRFAGDTDAATLLALLDEGDPTDAVCVLHVDAQDPEARKTAEACAERMMALCERIHGALEAKPGAEVLYVWNESRGRIDVLGKGKKSGRKGAQ